MVPITVKRDEIDADWGIRPAPLETLEGLRPVTEGGVVSYGSQTHPADGCAGLIVTSDPAEVRILSSGFARVGRGEMPKAPVPAARGRARRRRPRSSPTST